MSDDRYALGWVLTQAGISGAKHRVSVFDLARADAILASDWLAEHDARIAAEARKAALIEAGRLVRDHLFGSVDAARVAEFLDGRATRLGGAS